METAIPAPSEDLAPTSDLAQRAFDRASGAPLVAGNTARLLIDADEHHLVWLYAIRSAQRRILLENYIIEEDEIGLAYAAALSERARAGVKVRVLRDWLGSRSTASRGFWRSLAEAGVELRVYNPPQLGHPLGWISRDHRKLLTVDGEVGFVTGLCISKRWLGDPARNVPPWRDTGVELRGPAVAWIERAFKEVWDVSGAPLPEDALSDPATIPRAGDVSVRVVASAPSSTDLFRLDQMMASAAQRTLWLADAYFVAVAPYVQTLRRAARDGVDVRLLVPSTTDIPVISPMSRSGYRPLLEAGVRIFEWNGSMMHAKTAAVDGRWARVGSTNLNLASFIGNYELDVAIEDVLFAHALEEVYLRDLANSTEITLGPRRRVIPLAPRPAPPMRGSRRPPVGAVRFAKAVGTAATTGTRVLGAQESWLELALVAALLATAAVAIVWPAAVAHPIAAIAIWLSVALLLRARRNARLRKAAFNAESKAPPPPAPEQPAAPEREGASRAS